MAQPGPDPDDPSADRPVFNFGYVSASGPLNSYEDANGNYTEFAYRTDGTLETATAAYGTALASTVGYQSALSPPLTGGGEGTVGSSGNPALLVLSTTALGVMTDQSGSPTVMSFDEFGDPTSIENALGQTTAYQRDDNGLVTEMHQPDPTYGQPFYSGSPVTFYSYATDTGMLTGETDPTGALQSWSYTSFSTPGGNYVVPTQSSEGFGALAAGTTPPINQIQSFAWSATIGGTAETYTYNPDPSSWEEGGGTPAIYDNPAGDYFRATISGSTVSWTYYESGYDPLSVDTDPTDDAPAGRSAISFPPNVVDYLYYSSGDAGGNLGDLKSVTERDWPSNVVTQYTYTTPDSPGGSCPKGLVFTVQDPNGNVTTYEYYTSGSDAGLVSDVIEPHSAAVVGEPPALCRVVHRLYGRGHRPLQLRFGQ